MKSAGSTKFDPAEIFMMTLAMFSPMLAEPAEGSLDDPSFGQYLVIGPLAKTPGGIQLQFNIGSKKIVASIMGCREVAEQPEACEIIGQLKEIIGRLHPDAQFKDISV